MGWLDKTIEWVSPRWACNRAAWRQALTLQRNYDAASGIRPNDTWRGVNTSAELANSAYRETLRGNAQDMERNSDEAQAILLAYERNVVNVGPRLQAKVKQGENANEELNSQIENNFLTWCKPRNCDITRQQSFSELLCMGVRRRRVDGAAIWLKVYDGGGSFLPFTLQTKEVYDLDTSYVGKQSNGNLIVAGIELNSYNRPVAYWFRDVSADGFYVGSSTRVEANRVIFWWDRMRPSQVREMSLLAPSLTRLKDIREYLETVSVKEKIAACLALFITQSLPGAGTGRGTAADATSGYYPETMSPGMIMRGLPGDSAQAINPPANSAANARDFAGMLQRMAGAGQGLSFEVVSRDVSQANYSSARLNRLEDAASYAMEFKSLTDHVLDEVYSEFIISGYLAGQFDMPDFWKNRSNYMAHSFIAPGLPWVDPLKEAEAGTEAMNSNQESVMNLCSARGLDAREVVEQNAQIEVYAEQCRMDAYKKAGMEYPGPKAGAPPAEKPVKVKVKE